MLCSEISSSTLNDAIQKSLQKKISKLILIIVARKPTLSQQSTHKVKSLLPSVVEIRRGKFIAYSCFMIHAFCSTKLKVIHFSQQR